MWIIDAVTKTDKYITGYTSNTRFGKRSTLGGRIVADIDGKYNYHIGNDYNTPQRTKLYAPCDVEVLRIVSQGHGAGYGYQLFLYMIDYDKTLHLAHLNEIADIKVGQKLKEGTFVAYSGGADGTAGAGTSTGPHLHLGIASGKKSDTLKGKYMDGTWINPSDFKLGEKPKLSVEEVANQIMYGKNVWGNGEERVKNLKKEGYDPDEVQKAINALDKKPKPKPKPKPTFKQYSYTIPAKTTLYNASGEAYAKPTGRSHKVTILEEKNGLGRFKASWLVGVSEAWVKVGKTSKTSTNVGKTAQLRGTVYLYSTYSGTKPYNIPSGRSRDLKILEEKGNRFKVRSADFRPNTVWVNKKDVKVV